MRITSMKGTILFNLMCPLKYYDSTSDVTMRFSEPSHYSYVCMMHLTSGYEISNEFAFNKLSFDVPIMWLWRRL